MTVLLRSFADRAADLRRAFDDGFTEVRSAEAVDFVDLLSVRIGGDGYAVRISELAGLVNHVVVVALPGRHPDLLGIAGIRGHLVSVHALAPLLGHTGLEPSATPWLALAVGEPIALAFDHLEGFLRIPRREVHLAQASEKRRPHVVGAVRVGDASCPLVDIVTVVASIKSRANTTDATKEQ